MEINNKHKEILKIYEQKLKYFQVKQQKFTHTFQMHYYKKYNYQFNLN